MPVPLDFVFIGFAGDGNYGVNYSTSQIQLWFEHLDHVLPHTRIELADLSCIEDGAERLWGTNYSEVFLPYCDSSIAVHVFSGYCSGMVHGQHGSISEPVHSSVHLNFTSQVVHITRRSVMATFERAIHVFGRPVDPEIESGAHQV